MLIIWEIGSVQFSINNNGHFLHKFNLLYLIKLIIFNSIETDTTDYDKQSKGESWRWPLSAETGKETIDLKCSFTSYVSQNEPRIQDFENQRFFFYWFESENQKTLFNSRIRMSYSSSQETLFISVVSNKKLGDSSFLCQSPPLLRKG